MSILDQVEDMDDVRESDGSEVVLVGDEAKEVLGVKVTPN